MHPFQNNNGFSGNSPSSPLPSAPLPEYSQASMNPGQIPNQNMNMPGQSNFAYPNCPPQQQITGQNQMQNQFYPNQSQNFGNPLQPYPQQQNNLPYPGDKNQQNFGMGLNTNMNPSPYPAPSSNNALSFGNQAGGGMNSLFQPQAQPNNSGYLQQNISGYPPPPLMGQNQNQTGLFGYNTASYPPNSINNTASGYPQQFSMQQQQPANNVVGFNVGGFESNRPPPPPYPQ